MMKNRASIAPVLGALLLAAPLAPLSAQSGRVSAEEAIEASRDLYGPPAPRQNCSQANADNTQSEITVCAEQARDDAEFRVQSTSELDPESREALDDGLPRAPDVAGDGIFKGKGGISLGGAPPPAYMFDLSELPEAPEGSDADLIGKGEKRAD